MKVLTAETEKIGMVSSVRGDKIVINIGATEVVEAPLDDAEISVAPPEEAIDFIIEW